MAEIDESQSRITAALRRIDAGVETMRARTQGAVDAQTHRAVQTALQEEQAVSAQLRAQISALTAQHAEELKSAQASAVPASETAQLAALDAELQRLKATVAQLRETNSALREAQEAGLADPQVLNKSLSAELDALRAERAAEVAETSAILTALEPMLNGQGEGR